MGSSGHDWGCRTYPIIAGTSTWYFVFYLQPKSTNSGVYLFIRTNKLAKADVVKALQEGRSVLANSYGQLKGIATNREVNIPPLN